VSETSSAVRDTTLVGASRRWRARDHLPSLILFVAGVALSIGLAAWARSAARAREAASVERRANNLSVTLVGQRVLWMETLHNLESFFHSSDEVTRADFRDYVAPVLARHPEIAALEWFQRVDAAGRPALEARARAEGLPGYRVREDAADGRMVDAGPRDEYVAMLYMEPPDESALGLDLYASAERRARIAAARDRGEAVLSPRIRLVQDPEGVHAVAIYMPVYRRGAPLATIEQRRAAFAGVVAEIFRLRSLFEHGLAGLDVTGLDFVVLDRSAAGEARVLYESAAGVAGRMPPGEALTWRRAIPFAGRDWELQVFAEPDRFVGGAPATVLFGGLALTIVGAGLMSSWRVIGRLRRAAAAASRVGPYTLLEKLGEGGVGSVWKARHALLRRPTALKILRADRVAEADLKRFEREVQLTASLTHPNTIIVFDYGRTPDRTFYYAMEYLDGINLETLVTFHGPQHPGRVARILEQAAGALAEAHAAGLIHRDIKPSNLMLCRRGGLPDVVKVLDFGMVKERDVVSDVSESGISYGTPLYLAPESITRPDSIDGRTDLYSLGLVAYFLLTGERAVLGATLAEVLHQHVHVEPVPPSRHRRLPEGLEDIVVRCLAKDPAGRPASAAALRHELLALRDVPEWTEDDALAWWRSQEKDRASPRAASAPSR
jgi:serine/threonine-protein kinase